ncbi:MAG: macro domain-containing protein [Candidatus Magnetoovum sp. WYHC-5]|nr:macro domain-containing protein [Candidatus Magnetoovum sp. WYHC-5]
MSYNIDELKEKLRSFSHERNWDKYHSPKNLAIALLVEAAELVELFQWSSEEQSYQPTDDVIESLKDEMADVFIYLLNIADKFNVNIIEAAFNKIEKNEKKYPVDLVKGSALKYTKYKKMKIIAKKQIGSKILRLVQGDITSRDVDAIVNAANSMLQHGGGVAGAIVRKGGAEIQEESNRIGYVAVGGAVKTGAGRLPCKFVIHTVGPSMGEGDEDNKLICAINSVLTLALKSLFKSISVPAISSGIFGFPKERCAKILVHESRVFLERNQGGSLDVVEFCIIDDNTLAYFVNEFSAI